MNFMEKGKKKIQACTKMVHVIQVDMVLQYNF